MWMLTSTAGKIIEIDESKTTAVGRRYADILLENDNSISKFHAKILVLKSDDPSNKNDPMLVILDVGSKYGSFVIGKNNKLTRISQEGYHVKHGDTIRFGLQQHVFTVSYKCTHKYMILVSRIYGNERVELSEVLQSVGGILCDDWDSNCTHLTCPTVKLTEKVACALVNGLHIVTKNYWYALSEALQNNNEILPDPKAHTPEIDPSILVTDKISLLPNPLRKTIFQGKIFLYFDQDQLGIFSKMIELAGGSSIMYDETWKPQDCCKPNIIVVQSIESSQTSQSLPYECRAIYLRLAEEKLRRIPESEIPLAILWCSTSQYCNPRFKYDSLLKSNEDAKNKLIKETSSKILVPETQELASTFKSLNVNKKKKKIIPESVPVYESALTDTQMSSEVRTQKLSNADQVNHAILSNKQMKNGVKRREKPRILEVETVIPPLFSVGTAHNEPISFNRKDRLELNNSIDKFEDNVVDNNDDELSPPRRKSQRSPVKSPVDVVTKKKRPINKSPTISNNNNEKSLVKKRKLNNVNESNMYSSDEEINKSTSSKCIISNNKNDIVDRFANIVNNDSNVERTEEPHYYSRNNDIHPKCVIPMKRLTVNDMFEWKPNK